MLVTCQNCNQEFHKNKCDVKRTKNNFCSRSCSVSYHNRHSPKRLLASSKTLTEYESDNRRTFKSRVCDHARRTYTNSQQPLVCASCGYNTHVEIAHIKPVASFSGRTKISVVNAVSNLVALCPNHHWEFDHGLLTL